MPKESEIRAAMEARRKANDHPTPEADAFAKFWDLASQLRRKDNVPAIAKLEGLWIRKVDERWLMKANGHAEEIDGVPSFTFCVWFNGFPCGIINANGCTFGAGTLANLDEFNKALEAELHRGTPSQPGWEGQIIAK